MRIAIVTDAWEPQVNGVVRSIQAVNAVLERQGHEIKVISPNLFHSVPCPTYPEIRLALARVATIGAMLKDFAPDAVHLATEGPLCIAARRWCKRNHRPFTTAYHTQFPDYISARTRLPADWFWHYMRWFHGSAAAILTATKSLRRSLIDHGLKNVRHWGRGVDLARFHPAVPPHAAMDALAGPVQLYVGRVAIEKNIDAFLRIDNGGTKVVVGDGPARAQLKSQYPAVHFLGAMKGAELASAYRAADVFVFPSKTDTFGLVMLEALACGVPVAAFPVMGPIDILTEKVGAMDRDLAAAIDRALLCNPTDCAAYAKQFTWEESARQFLDAISDAPSAAKGVALERAAQ